MPPSKLVGRERRKEKKNPFASRIDPKKESEGKSHMLREGRRDAMRCRAGENFSQPSSFMGRERGGGEKNKGGGESFSQSPLLS